MATPERRPVLVSCGTGSRQPVANASKRRLVGSSTSRTSRVSSPRAPAVPQSSHAAARITATRRRGTSRLIRIMHAPGDVGMD